VSDTQGADTEGGLEHSGRPIPDQHVHGVALFLVVLVAVMVSVGSVTAPAQVTSVVAMWLCYKDAKELAYERLADD